MLTRNKLSQLHFLDIIVFLAQKAVIMKHPLEPDIISLYQHGKHSSPLTPILVPHLQCTTICAFKTNLKMEKQCVAISRLRTNKLRDKHHILFECTICNEKVVLNRIKYVPTFYLRGARMFQCINLLMSENNKDIRN